MSPFYHPLKLCQPLISPSVRITCYYFLPEYNVSLVVFLNSSEPEPMPARPLRNRLIPYKLLAICLYSKSITLLKRDRLGIELRLGPLSRHLRVSSSRLRDQLQWLLANGYFSQLALSRGVAVVTVQPPIGLFPQDSCRGLPPTSDVFIVHSKE